MILDESLLDILRKSPMPPSQLIEKLAISQPSFSRAIKRLGERVVKIGKGKSIHYARRKRADVPVFRVNEEGCVCRVGVLVAVSPEGYVLRQEEGRTQYSENLPWWLLDAVPQGYLGRAIAQGLPKTLGFNSNIKRWNDAEVLRFLQLFGEDHVGNVLLGDDAVNRFLNLPHQESVQDKAIYTQLAHHASTGDKPGSSAGGEQPKFTVYAQVAGEPKHLLVKFSEAQENPVSERWRDLLLIEHLALNTLNAFGVLAARTSIVDIASQRFLEVERFDRVGESGRRDVVSLRALDAEFVGKGDEIWPEIVKNLPVEQSTVALVECVWAFGFLIGNTDMHLGNLSFIGCESGYILSPIYDMTSMAFAPTSGGGLRDTLILDTLNLTISIASWKKAIVMVESFLSLVKQERKLSGRFTPCVIALDTHISRFRVQIDKLSSSRVS